MYYISNIIEDINKFLRRNYMWFFPLIISILFEISFVCLYRESYLSIKHVDNNTVLTISLTIAGFLLTDMGIMISVRDKPFIQSLIKAKYWDKIEDSNFTGVIFTVISSFLSIYNIIIKQANIYLINIELLTFIISITYFVMVVVWLYKAFKYI